VWIPSLLFPCGQTTIVSLARFATEEEQG
jgi:hypothetical protein